MGIGTLLFSFQGRVNRSKYWLANLIWLVGIVLVMLAAVFATMGLQLQSADVIARVLAISAAGIAIVIVMASSFAVAIKRLHDRDKSGWWLIVFYLLPGVIGALPVLLGATSAVRGSVQLLANVLQIWGFVEIGCLRGTRGPNRFGADPLQEETIAEVFQ
jgi:uncharacterized membrane protein YhaH (DUF805 family)